MPKTLYPWTSVSLRLELAVAAMNVAGRGGRDRGRGCRQAASNECGKEREGGWGNGQIMNQIKVASSSHAASLFIMIQVITNRFHD